jgi:hypothetical protein
VNAAEGTLVYLPTRDLGKAEALDREGALVPALSSYRAFVNNWPGEIVMIFKASERIDAIQAKVDRAEEELFATIQGEQEDPRRRLGFCAVYAQQFSSGRYRSEVKAIGAEAKKKIAKMKWEEKLFAAIALANDAAARLGNANKYLRYYPDGLHVAQAQRAQIQARAWLDQIAEQQRRDSVGKTQRGWGIAAMVVGGATGIVGGILGGITLSNYNGLEEACKESNSSGCLESEIDSNHSRAVATNWILGVGLTLFTTGIIVIATAPSGKEKPPVSASVVPTQDGAGAILGVGGRF